MRAAYLFRWLAVVSITCVSALTNGCAAPGAQGRATIGGAAAGAVAGGVAAAYAVFPQGAGGGSSGEMPWLAAGTLLGAIGGASAGYLLSGRSPASAVPRPVGQSAPSPLNPIPGQFDLQIAGLFGFTGPGSIVRVREFETEGTGLSFSDMGMNTERMPTLDLRYWFDRVDAIHFRLRYFNIGGSKFSPTPIKFNGAIIPGGRANNFGPWEWLSGGLYYERRLTPLYDRHEAGWPSLFQGWDVRGRFGVEFTYLNFSINGGRTAATLARGGKETKEDFYHQSMPLPTIGLEAYRKLTHDLLFEGEVEGNWINRWNSLRGEGGTVWASQNGIEAHARLYYSHPSWFGPIQPMAGFFFYYYSQLEDSHEDGNFIRWSSYGPEVGINYSF